MLVVVLVIEILKQLGVLALVVMALTMVVQILDKMP
jgi:hypothetical protein